MKTEKRTITRKVRFSQTEYEKFIKNLQKSGAKNESEFIRLKTLSTQKQQARQLRMTSKQDQEQRQKCLMILSDMCSSINQLKAGVDTPNAIVNLEKEANELWRALK